jgi:hypothetical protein
MTKTCFIYWDDLSYQLSNPDSSFSIINVQGKPYSINWDSGSHIINNPDNFSYSITYSDNTDIQIYFIYNGETYTLGLSGDTSIVYYKGVFNTYNFKIINGKPNIGFLNTPDTFRTECPSPNRIAKVLDTSGTIWQSSVWTKKQNDTAIYGTYPLFDQGYSQGSHWSNYCVRNNGFASLNLIIKANPNASQILKIIDNNITYNYPIIDKNSVQIINSDPSNKIEIEGHQFDIINTDSARKDCTEQCPLDTITCDCGNERCCYKQVEHGYQLVKTINL